MLRRRLTAYTIMYIAGITAGYFMWEQTRVIGASCFLAALSASVVYADIWGSSSGSGKGREYIEKEKKKEDRQRLILTAFMLTGFLVFTINYAVSESVSAACLKTDEAYSGSICRIRGRVTNADIKDGILILTAVCSDISAGEEEGRSGNGQAGFPGRIRITVKNHDHDEAVELIGKEIEAAGRYKETAAADNPGCFDYRLYMKGKGVYISFRADSIELLSDPQYLRGLYITAKRRLFRTRESFVSRFDEETSGFIRGVIFGDKSEIDEDTLNEFNINSTGHILAVSGLHIGFLYSLLRFLSGRRRTLAVSLSIIAVLIIYGEMTMWSAATQRACIVMSISLMSVHFRRPFDLLTAVSLAAMIILAGNPYQLFDAGFRMSFLAMSGMAVLVKPLSSVIGEALGVPAAIQLSIIPISAYTFYRMNLLSVFINIPIILLASVLVPLCIALLLIMMISGWMPGAGIYLVELISAAIIYINHFLSFGGGFSYMAAGIGGASVLIFYAAAFGLSSEWTRIMLLRKRYRELLKTAALLMIPLAVLSMCMSGRLSDCDIIFVAVGQGDCTHIRAGGHDILIDGGGREDFNTGKQILMPYLLHGGSSALDMALVTHLHQDHFKGISELDEVFPVGAIGIPVDYRNASPEDGRNKSTDKDKDTDNDNEPLNASGDRTRYIRPDSVIHLTDEVCIDVLWPIEISDEPVSASDPNEHNTVYMIRFKDIRVMVTGDLLEEDELKMVEYYSGAEPGALRCDILKVAHHGSRSSSSEAFLDAASPDFAVIQAGRGNLYGHPHQQTLDRLEERGIRVYRTDLNGAVGFTIRPNRIIADSFRR